MDDEHRYVGEGTMSPEGTSEVDYLWRAPRCTPFPRPKSSVVGEIGWGIPQYVDWNVIAKGRPIRVSGSVAFQKGASYRDWKTWKMKVVMEKSWNIKKNFVISHGILPIWPLNFTKFVPFLQTLRNLAKHRKVCSFDLFRKMSRMQI